jgi:hypothetical protein
MLLSPLLPRLKQSKKQQPNTGGNVSGPAWTTSALIAF